MKTLDVIVPSFNEEKNISDFFKEISKELKPVDLDWRIIFVNDGSKDNTLSIIKKLAAIHEEVFYISFSKNFGKESALYAGLKKSTADYVTIMDADFQDPPFLIPKMLDCMRNSNYDVISCRRTNRKGEPAIRSFFARLFYKIINRVTDVSLVDGARDFRLMTRPVVDAVLELTEYNRFSKGIFEWVGFDTHWIEYENVERTEGESSWSFWSLFKYSIEGIISFTTAPLNVAIVLGLIISLISFIAILFIVLRTLLFGDPVEGWPSTISIILFVSGIQLFTIGILGQYISRIYLETKKRPLYLIKETNIDD